MSKAFTSEENEDEGGIEMPTLPPGVKNYMTPACAARMRAELEELEHERKAKTGSDVQSQARLPKIERRIRFLMDRLERAQIIDPLSQPKDRVLFGATVTVQEGSGAPQKWRIVGLDEMDLDKGWISWMSPLASALLDKGVGDVVSFMNRRISILAVEYKA